MLKNLFDLFICVPLVKLLSSRQPRQHCQVDFESSKILEHAIDKLDLSAGAFNKVLKVARTVADLANSEGIIPEHIMEANQYRDLNKSKNRV